MDQGELVEDHIVIGMIRNKMEAHLDGLHLRRFHAPKPRPRALDEMLNSKSEPITHMLALEVPEEELVKRLLGRRATQWPSGRQGRVHHPQPDPRVREEDRTAEGLLRGTGQVHRHRRGGFRGGDHRTSGEGHRRPRRGRLNL